MARGNLDDFTNKFGFNDGESVENRDFTARDQLVKLLNAHLTDYVLAPYDRPGCHNACLIICYKKIPGHPIDDYPNEQCEDVDITDVLLALDGDVVEGCIRAAYDFADAEEVKTWKEQQCGK
jgi:hypothetical protein